MSFVVETHSLTKHFPKLSGWRSLIAQKGSYQPAVDGVNLAVKEGELFGLLGPNGAGKTTLIKMLSTLIQPTSGSASVNGYTLSKDIEIKASIGLVTSDERSFYWRLTGHQNLVFFATLHGIPQTEITERVNTVLEQVGLTSVANQRFLTYSTGTRQRLCIARALLHQPSLLILDEPTKGLDPLATRNLHRLIKEQLRAQLGMTIFLTTHNLEEAKILCDRIAIMDRGQIRVCGTLTELQETLQLSERYQVWVNEFSQQKINTLENNLPGVSIKIISQSEDRNESVFDGDRATCLEFYNLPEHDSLNNVLDQLRLTDCIILNVAQIFPSLEQIFSHHTELFDQNALYPTQIQDHTTIPAKPSTIPANEHVGITIKRKHSKASFALIAKAFLIRDYLDESSYRVAFVIQFLNIVFSVGVFYFISLLVGDSAEPYLSDYGGDYFSFVLIGIAFSGYFGVGLSSFSNRLRQAQTTGTLEAMLATPARLSEIIISSSLWEYIMTTLRVVVYLAVGVLLMNANLNGNIFAATVILILTIITFSSLGIISASFVMVLKRGDPVAWAFSAVSTLLGGVYYPITILPDWLQMLARLLPITYALEGMRLALLQDASVNEILPQIVALIIFSVILLPGSLFSFRYAVKRAKIEGSLTHY